MTRFPVMEPPALALVLDLDGTVADTFPAMAAAYAAAVGREVSEAELLRLFGPGAGTEAQILVQLGAASQEALALWYDHYLAAHDAIVLFEGVRTGLLRARQRGLRLGMLTGKGRRSTDITLDALGLTPLLDAVVTGDEAPAPKPDPRGLLMVAATLGVHPSRAVYVGDSLADLGAAQAARMTFAAALWDARASVARATERPVYALRGPQDLDCLIDAACGGPERRTDTAPDQR